MSRRALPVDYDEDPERFVANQAATATYSRRGDAHGPVARRLAALGVREVLDLGSGTGTLARELSARGVRTILVDAAEHVRHAPRPAIRADISALPFRSDSVASAACLWTLYHLDDPTEVLREAARVVQPGGWFVACTSARTNDPEFAGVLPGWGEPGTFDAEDAEAIVGSVMVDVETEHWDAPMIELPDRAAVAMFLRGRGLSRQEVERRAGTVDPPLTVTKRGCLVWARVPD